MKGQKTEKQAVPGAISMVGAADTARYKALARRYMVECLGQGRLGLVDEFLTEDCTLHHPILEQPIQGRQEITRFAKNFLDVFPGWEVKLGDLIGEGNKVALGVAIRAKGKGKFFGIDATGKDLRWTVVNMFHFRDERIAEIWVCENTLTILKQLGVSPLSAK